MTKTRGMLTLEQLKGMVAQGEVETVLAGFTDHYGRLMGKRFDAEMFLDEIAKHGGHACDYLLTVDMEMEPVPGYKFANWELGYGDVHMVPDLATLRIASWLDKTAFVLCDVKSEKTHDYVAVAPRSILRRQVDAAKKLGFAGYAGTELEHFLYQTSFRQAALQDFRFPPVQESEVPDLRIEISRLTPPLLLDFATPDELTARLRPGGSRLHQRRSLLCGPGHGRRQDQRQILQPVRMGRRPARGE